MAAVCILIAALESWRSRELLSPLNLIAAIFLWLYVAKGFYILDTEFTSPAAIADGSPLTASLMADLNGSLLVAQVALLSLTAAFWVTSPPPTHTLPIRIATSRSLSEHRWITVTWLAMGVAIASYGWLILRAGGLSAYIDSLALRSSALEGVAFLTLANVPLTILLFAGLTAAIDRQQPSSKFLKWTLGTGIAVSVGTAVLTGGRAALLTGTLLPLFLLWHYLRRPIGLVGAVLAGVAGFTLLLVMGALLRDRAFAADGSDPWTFVSSRFADVGASMLGGVEAVPLDTLMVTYREITTGSTPLQFGSTYLPIFSWPIPRGVWPEKPEGGGNAWFTSEFVPRFYGPNGVETSISLVGESFANFSWPGVIIAAAIVGLLLSMLYSRLRSGRTSSSSIVSYAIFSSYLFPIVRGDAYHNVTSIFFALVVWQLLRPIVEDRSAAPFRASNSLADRTQRRFA